MLSTLNGSNGFQINGEAEQDRLGFSVSSAGDMNGDGIDDLLISAPWAAPNGYASGASYVVFGSGAGFPAELILSNLNGVNGFQISGEPDVQRAGTQLASAGDINGDGFDEVLIAANDGDSRTSYLVFGKGTGFDANLNLSSLDGANGFEIRVSEATGPSGFVSVSSAGDINRDGFDDLVVGNGDAHVNATRSGESYVVFGRAAGFGADLQLSTLNGTDGFKIGGEAVDSFSVSRYGCRRYQRRRLRRPVDRRPGNR